MRNEEVPFEKILCKIVEGAVLGAETVGGGDAGDAGEFVHVLGGGLVTIVLGRVGGRVGGIGVEKGVNTDRAQHTTSVQLPANHVLFLPLINIIPGTTRT